MLDLVRQIAQRIYNQLIRHRLPRYTGVYNGVATKKYYLLDISSNDFEPDYKQTLISIVRSEVEKGDTVAEIGSGFGVCTTWLAREVGENGRVYSYEASENQVNVAREALKINSTIVEDDLAPRVTVKHALVGGANAVYGPENDVKTISINDIPNCNVLVSDCEGAELSILKEMNDFPDTLIVETHPSFGAGTDDIAPILENKGYQCKRKHVSDTDVGPKHILVGTK